MKKKSICSCICCFLQCFRVLWYICVVLGFATVLSAYFFYKYDFAKPSLWIAVMAVLLKHSWGFLVAFVLLGLIYQYGWFIPNIFNYPGWRIIGRISYATFICHLFILKLLMSGIHQPMYLSVFNILKYSLVKSFKILLTFLFLDVLCLRCFWDQ
jgi:peptidoglycan/LPS O-acetylase OafA/YrhL